MRIGALSRATGVSTRLLRYYEQQGLLAPIRSSNGYRDYTAEAVGVVAQVRQMLGIGLPTAVIRDVLPCTGAAGADTGACPPLLARIAQLRDQMSARAAEAAQVAGALSAYFHVAAAHAATRPATLPVPASPADHQPGSGTAGPRGRPPESTP